MENITVKPKLKQRIYFNLKVLKIEKLDQKLLLLITSLLLSRLSFNQTPLLLFLPILLLSTLMGFSTLIFTTAGIILGALTMGPYYVLYYSLGISIFLILSIILKFLPFNYPYRLSVSLLISDIIFRFMVYSYLRLAIDQSLLLMSFISLLLSFGAIETFKEMMNKNKTYYPPLLIFFIGILSLLALASLPTIPSIIDYRLGLIILCSLLISRYCGGLIGASLATISAFTSLLFLNLAPNDFILLILSLSLSSLIIDKGKIITSLFYAFLVYSLSLYLSINQSTSLLMLYGLPLITYLILPTNLFKFEAKMPNPSVMMKLQQKQFNQLQVEITNKIKSISDLFNEVSVQLKENENVKIIRKELEVIYRHLCINCPKSQICFQTNSNNLVNLMQKAIDDTLDSTDEKYIYYTCLKPAKYLANVNEYKEQYYTQYKYSQEYNLVKQMVYYQLDGVSKVLNDYASEMLTLRRFNQDEMSERVKIALDMLQIDYIYVKVTKDYLSYPVLEMALKITSDDNIKEIISYLEEKINCNIEITLTRQNNFDNYFIVIGFIKPQYQLIYGVGQLSEDEACSGDSYSCFAYKNKFVLALSDGMGIGQEAKKESDATLSLLKKMLEADMDDNKAIVTINTLLKLKNRIDTYATLDFLTFDKTNANLRFIKNGAPSSYLIRDNELIAVDNYSLPIGIINEITPFDYKTKAQVNDLIVLVSDGIEEHLKEELPKLLLKYKNQHPQVIVKNIINRCQEDDYNDDISIIVARVEKSVV